MTEYVHECEHKNISVLMFGFRCEDCGEVWNIANAINAIRATERLSVIYDSIDDYLAPVTVKGTTEDEYVPVEASTLAWWMDALEDILEGKDD